MIDPLNQDPNDTTEEAQAATKAAVFVAAERLFALHGFQNVSVRDITAAACVNLASVNYHFGSKDALLFEIFRRRTAELNRERARMLHEAGGRHEGKPPVREILRPTSPRQCVGPHPTMSVASRCSSSSALGPKAMPTCATCCRTTSAIWRALPTP